MMQIHKILACAILHAVNGVTHEGDFCLSTTDQVCNAHIIAGNLMIDTNYEGATVDAKNFPNLIEVQGIRP